MLFYFNQENPFWDETKKEELYDKFVEELQLDGVGYSHNNYKPYELNDPRFGKKPYIEMDCFGSSGVYIRKITHLTDDEIKTLTQKSNMVFLNLMGKQGRNERCKCGSGKKFKTCCLN